MVPFYTSGNSTDVLVFRKKNLYKGKRVSYFEGFPNLEGTQNVMKFKT